MFHRITIVGFVGQSPSMRYTKDGTPVTHFFVAPRQFLIACVARGQRAGCALAACHAALACHRIIGYSGR